ncbi:MAG: WD40 repeat domain-containing protein [Campylobacterales bacterium]|nr:WD40 repeat domain-containing protein [Campylobacterales bacterium]
MPLLTPLAHFDSPLALIHPLHSAMLGIVTLDHHVYLCDTQTRSIDKLLHLNVPDDADVLYAFDSHSTRLLFGLKEGKILHMIDARQKKLINRFELDQQSPTSLSFSPDGSHFVCGTDQGRVLLWRCDSTTLVARLHSFPEFTSLYVRPKTNFVSALAFEGKQLATSGYGGSIVVTDYQSQTQTKRFHPGTMKINALLFYKNTLIAGNQEGTLLKIDRSGKHPNQRLPLPHGPIRYLFRTGTPPYALAVYEHHYVSLINLETMKTVQERYIELDEPITCASKGEDGHLYLGTATGKLYLCDLVPLSRLESLIDSKSYAEAYRYCDQEPLLQNTPPHQMLESIFADVMRAAQNALEKGQTAQAAELLKPFQTAKSQEIGALNSAFSYLKRFTYLFENQKFSPFYGLAEQYPPLQSTPLFKQAEKLWTERFIMAQKLMLVSHIKEARSAVEPFAAVNSKRPLIQLLLHNIDVLKTYSKALHEHDYSELVRLTQRYPALRKLPSYLQLNEMAGEHSQAIVEALKSKSFDQARSLLHKLGGMIQYEEEYAHLKNYIALASNLEHAISNAHWRSAYQLLDTHPELMILPWAEELETQWDDKLRQCETFAIRGDVSAIKKTLGNLINLPNRHERIGDLLRMGYQVQLKALLLNDPQLFSEGAEHYCDVFGIDTELRQLLKKAQRHKIQIGIDPQRMHPKKRDQWLMSARTLADRIA